MKPLTSLRKVVSRLTLTRPSGLPRDVLSGLYAWLCNAEMSIGGSSPSQHDCASWQPFYQRINNHDSLFPSSILHFFGINDSPSCCRHVRHKRDSREDGDKVLAHGILELKSFFLPLLKASGLSRSPCLRKPSSAICRKFLAASSFLSGESLER